MASGGRNHLFVAAIDFGTTYSGFAFSATQDFKDDPLKISANIWNSGEKGYMTEKTPTILLLKKDASFRAFGYEAETVYSSLCSEIDDSDDDDSDTEKENPKEMYYFHRFKMELHKTKSITEQTPVKDLNGKTLPAITVFKEAIKYLKDTLFEKLKNAYPGILTKDIRYVITVPTIWDDAAKAFMEKAAIEAGIDKEALEIGLEPESASVYCFQECKVDKLKDFMQPGHMFMVCDLGGGTADITVHQWEEGDTLKELRPASGGPWGGKAVDDAFLRFVEEICGEKNIQKLKEESMEDYISLFNREFEVKKRKQLDESNVVFTVPFSLSSLMKKDKKHGSLDAAVKSSRYTAQNVKYDASKGKLFIPPETFKELFFQPIADNIIKHLDQIFKENRRFYGMEIILMVGGFSGCAIITDAIQKAFHEKKVIVPREAETAVLKGAVMYGHKPKVISQRMARFTYGMQNWPIFDAQRHPLRKKVMVNGQARCKDTFLKFVEFGQELTPPHEVKRTFQVLQVENNKFECKIYKTTKRDPDFVDDPGVLLVGILEIPMTLDGNETVDLEETLIFGDTHLRFTARNSRTGQQYETSFTLVPGDAY